MSLFQNSERDRGMDYLEFFNIKDDPFRITPDSEYFYPSQEHNEILSSLTYAVKQKEGFFLATGEPGTGKTTILKVFLNEWKDKAEIALVMTPRLSPEEFLLAVLEDFNIPVSSNNKNDIIKVFRDFLLRHSHEGRRVIIIVDEVQNLPDETLEELRLLSNLETDKEKLLQIILIGQPEFRKRLESHSLRQLNQRITVRTALRSLNVSETQDYMNFRLMKAGHGPVFFELKAKKLIHSYSKGTPRLINLLSSRAMMAAYVDGSRNIKDKHIVYAANNVFDESFRNRDRVKTFLKYAALFLVVLVAAVQISFTMRSKTDVVKQPEQTNTPALTETTQPSTARPNTAKKAANSKPASQIVSNNPRSHPDTAKHVKQSAESSAIESVQSLSPTLIIEKEVVNLRTGPQIEFPAVSWALRGRTFPILDAKADTDGHKWFKIKVDVGKELWVSNSVVKVNQKAIEEGR